MPQRSTPPSHKVAAMSSFKPVDKLSLFDACDLAADLMRRIDCSYSEADDVIVFRCLQQQKMPGLSDAQAHELLTEWLELYAAKVVLDRQDAIKKVMRFAEAHA